MDEETTAGGRDLHADGVIYSEEDFLQLSGLQHFKFCRRQWALIHVENQWAENSRTTDGAILHENAHNGGFAESRGDLLITAGYAYLFPDAGCVRRLRCVGIPPGQDRHSAQRPGGAVAALSRGVQAGRAKEDTADALQLCGQAMCLEEMLCCEIPQGALYYGEPRRRTEVDFTPELRQEVRRSA